MQETNRDSVGAEMYLKVLGQPAPNTQNLTGIQELSINHLFGKIWSRKGLSIRDRRLITICLLASQGKVPQLKSHIRGARLGSDKLSEEEILELMTHIAHYAGWASGVSGQSTAMAVFKELAESET